MTDPVVVLDATACVEEVRVKISAYPRTTWCVIREELEHEIVWYVLEAGVLLTEIRCAARELPIRDFIDRRWHRAEVRTVFDWKRLRPRARHTLVLDGTEVVGVVPGEGEAIVPGVYRDWMPRLSVGDLDPTPTERFLAWPSVTAPSVALPGDEFVLTVALSREQHAQARAVAVEVLEGETELELEVDVAAVGLEAADGWRRKLCFNTAGELPSTSIPLRVCPDTAHGRVLIHVAFLHRGIVCGNATCAMSIGPGTAAVVPGASSPCSVPESDEEAADLTIMIRKADGNGATGRYVWSMCSTRVTIDTRPFPFDLGDDVRTFARSLMRELADHNQTALLEPVLRSIGKEIAARIPSAFWDALRTVATAVAPQQRPPALLLYSAEEFVPWELALMDAPLSDGPPYLGAQTVIGRWLHSQSGVVPARPPSSIALNDVAVLASESDSGELPHALAEAKYLVDTYGAIAVEATDTAVRRLLNAEVARNDGSPAEISVVHFACHGSSDPTRPGFAGIFLSNGQRVSPHAFGATTLGSRFGPLLFINACEVGMPQRVLNDNAGFAGISLRGGFRGFIGPLWAIDDEAAGTAAHHFYDAILGEHAPAIGSVIRDIRRSFLSGNEVASLSYVYYGHPRLRLQQ